MNAVLRALLLVAILLGCPVASAQSPLPAPDAKAIRDVIEAQLDAFRKDDAPRAFSLATPGIREVFGTPEKFMEMVRGSYAVVYRPASVAFQPPLELDGQVVQPVRMIDAQGRAWIALYPMVKQPDGQWRTNGCQLARLPGQQV